jgi:hypothetical protein
VLPSQLSKYLPKVRSASEYAAAMIFNLTS